MAENQLEKAADLVGWAALGRACGVTYMAVKKWSDQGHLPLACHTPHRDGYLQDYAQRLADATDNRVTVEDLLDWSWATWVLKYGD